MDISQPAGTPVHAGGGQAIARPPQQATGPRLPRIRVSSPADVLAVIPHLLGYHPARSFVIVGARGPRQEVQAGFRYDLPDPPSAVTAAGLAGHAARVLAHQRATTAIAVGYGPGALVTPVADAFAAALVHRQIRLQELLRADGGRYWSYLCRDVSCCPAEGVPFDYQSHPAAATMTAAGLAAYPDREARGRALLPLAGAAAEAMAQAVERACDRAAALTARAASQALPRPHQLVVEEGRRAAGRAIATYRAGQRLTADDEFAWLMVALASLPVRDHAWACMDPEYRQAHLALWTDVVRRAPAAWLPAPAALLAFTAWQSGDGTLANLALDRALACDPGYSMALLLREILDSGAPPSAARLPMTPDDVAESYDRAGQPGRRAARGPRPRGRRSSGSRPRDRR